MGVVIGIYQLRQQRNLSKTQAQREAYRIAGERCDYYGREVIPLDILLTKEMEASNCELLKKCKVDVSDEGISIKPEGITKDDAEKMNLHAEKLSKCINSVEGFAVFFVTGVADDNVGFLTCGRAFVGFFEKYLPVYAMSNSLEHHAKATQTLYSRWKGRIRQLELVAQQEEIKKKLNPKKAKPAKPFGC